MKKLLFFTVIFFFCHSLTSQPQRSQQKMTPLYTVSGERHGISFFPEARLKGVQYETGDVLSFDTYHSLNVIYDWLEKWADEYPGLIDLYEMGRSFENRPIMQITLTNKKTGKDTDKPAAFFEGNRHSGEITSAECVMWMIKYLLDNYGKDPEVTHLIDTKTIYLKPVNNPDGHNLYLHTAQSNRSTVRPDDNDNDGLLDEDAPDDLDSNGVILTMRWKDEKKGNLIADPRDTTGRIMKRVAAGKGTYLSSGEGIDNDNDGRINEDGIGGLDLHRDLGLRKVHSPPGNHVRVDLTNRGVRAPVGVHDCCWKVLMLYTEEVPDLVASQPEEADDACIPERQGHRSG